METEDVLSPCKVLDLTDEKGLFCSVIVFGRCKIRVIILKF